MKKNPKIELANSKSKKALDIIQSLLPKEIWDSNQSSWDGAKFTFLIYLEC